MVVNTLVVVLPLAAVAAIGAGLAWSWLHRGGR